MGNARLLRRLVLFVVVGLVVLTRPGVGAQPGGGDAERGERVFRAECAMCHGVDAAGMMGMHPSLGGAVERLSPEGVEVTIRKGRNTMPPMPAFEDRLTDEAIAEVIAYLDSLPPGPRNFGPEGGRGGMGGVMGGADPGDGEDSTAVWLLAALVVVVLALVMLVVLAARQRRTGEGAGALDARSVLDHRYAAGELSREEYLERRRDFES